MKRDLVQLVWAALGATLVFGFWFLYAVAIYFAPPLLRGVLCALVLVGVFLLFVFARHALVEPDSDQDLDAESGR